MILRPIVCARFIGRGEELAYLHERRREASASRGGLVLVSGEAGLGKSRLLAEFSGTLSKSRYRVARAACVEFAQRAYGPILEILGQLEAGARDLAPRASQHDQFDAILSTLLATSQRRTVVATIDDIHWADIATIELLGFLASRLAATRLLIVASLRPEVVGEEHPGYATLARLRLAPQVGHVRLSPLSNDELNAFMDDALGGIALPAETRLVIARTSEGNPFFVEELLKSALERTEQRSTHAAGLPTSIHATVVERARLLTADERQALAYAAVIGRTFDIHVLAQTLGADVDSLLQRLHRPRDLQLIDETSEEMFSFRHALTREAIYCDFFGAELRKLHQRIAEVLEQRTDAAVDDLAYHWWAAGDRGRAALYNERAGDAAGRLNAHEDAIVSYSRALECVDDDDAKMRLWDKMARHRRALGHLAAAIEHLDQAAEVAGQRGDIAKETLFRAAQAELRHSIADPDPVRDLRDLLNKIPLDQPIARAWLHLAIASISALRFELEQARTHWAAATESAAGDAELAFLDKGVRAMITLMEGDLARARADHPGYVAAATQRATLSGESFAESIGTFIFGALGDHALAAQCGRRAVELAQRDAHERALAQAHVTSAFTALMAGDLTEGRKHILLTPELGRADQLVMMHQAAWGSLIALYLEDDELMERCFDRLQNRVLPSFAYLYAGGYAEIFERRGRSDQARAVLHDALAFAERPRGVIFTLLAAARYADAADVTRAEALIRGCASAGESSVEHAALGLFRAYVALRAGDRVESQDLAATAVAPLARVAYPLLEAAARELAGDVAGALDLYRKVGATAHIRRLDRSSRSAAGTNGADQHSVLSAREREIAARVARGASNQEIAAALAISHKTVEKHLGSVYEKLGFRSRSQLAAHAADFVDGGTAK